MDLNIQIPDPLDANIAGYFDKCEEKLGMVPHVLKAYAFDAAKFAGFTTLYNDLMLSESGLSRLEREMIAVVVSSINKCFYCLSAHGAAVRELSGDPLLGEVLVMNFRAASLSDRHYAMLVYAEKVTEQPSRMLDSDRLPLVDAGFSDRDIWDIAAVAAFFNMSNRMASAIDMRPNDAYHSKNREEK
ncbi:MAG: peroxidase-related enzyme [Cohaesibacteraceae bacterium]|nr:peroxidase-related enzyme [Cohaesibacteraceae bacterium]MBL4877033.1 peroxidase-related enzyme [Cohaesibacteraceae bacterium]